MRSVERLIRRCGLHRDSRARRQAAVQGTVPATESLEDRVLLAASATLLPSGTLEIVGTDGDDVITMNQAAGILTVVVNGDSCDFNKNVVDDIRVLALGGNDMVDGREAPIPTRVDGASGDDTIRTGAGRDTIRGGAGNDDLNGFRGDDDLAGGKGADLLRGQPGNDTLGGGNGSDTLLASEGFDRVVGGDGNDVIRGGADGDTLDGGHGDDMLDGAGGNDSMIGGGGVDQLMGGDGDDTMLGGSGGDTLRGDAGSDLMMGAAGRDSIVGAGGRDLIVGGDERDTLFGNGDDDLIIAGTTNLEPDDLTMILEEWRSGRTYDERAANIRNGDGKTNARLNGNTFLIGLNRNQAANVFNDVGFIDIMEGQAARDWFWLSDGVGDDDLNDHSSTERRDEI